jgi:hypothetical protein
MSASPNAERRTKAVSEAANKGFFAVDRRAWARVSSLGLNPAVAYLVLACGTGGDNRTTKWSDQAIQKYTGLSRGRTNRAMADLKGSGLVREDEGGTRPRYYIMPAHEVPGSEGYASDKLTDAEQRVLSELKLGQNMSLSTRSRGDLARIMQRPDVSASVCRAFW